MSTGYQLVSRTSAEVTFPIAVFKYSDKRNLMEKGLVLSPGYRVLSIMFWDVKVAEPCCNWPHCTQEAKNSECWYSIFYFFLFRSGFQATRMVMPTVKVGLSSSVNKTIHHRLAQQPIS